MKRRNFIGSLFAAGGLAKGNVLAVDGAGQGSTGSGEMEIPSEKIRPLINHTANAKSIDFDFYATIDGAMLRQAIERQDKANERY